MRARLLALALVAVGCDKKEKPPAPPAATSQPGKAASAPPLAPRQGAPLAVVLRADEPARVASLGDLTVAFSGAMIFEIDDKALVQRPRLMQGMENASEVTGLSGAFPDPAWLATTLYSRISGQATGKRVYRWYAKRWGPAAAPLHDDPPLAIAEDGARSLALYKGDPSPRLVVARSMDARTAPAFPDVKGAEAARTELVSGAPLVLVAPGRGGAASAVLTLEGDAFAPSRSDLVVTATASHPKAGPLLAGRLGGKTVIARRVDGAWRDVVVELGAPTRAAIAADGTVAVAAGKTVLVRDASGATSTHEAPADLTSLVVLPGGAVWASTEKEIVSTTAGEAFSVPDKASVWQIRGLYGQAPATRACKDLWVPLASLGPTRGFVPEDLPWLEDEQLKQGDLGKSSFVVEDDGVKMTVGAIVTSIAAGDTIIATIGKRAGISGQPVLCHSPEVTFRFVKGKRIRG